MQRRGVAWLLASAALLCCPSAAQGSIDAALKTFNGAWPQGCANVTIEQGSDPDPTVSGYATPGTCTVYLTDNFLAQSPQPEVVCAVVVHEFGHLLGLQHTDREGDIMNPRPVPPPACLTPETPVAESTARAATDGGPAPAAGGQQPTTGTALHSGRASRSCARVARASTKRRKSASKRTRRRSCRATGARAS